MEKEKMFSREDSNNEDPKDIDESVTLREISRSYKKPLIWSFLLVAVLIIIYLVANRGMEIKKKEPGEEPFSSEDEGEEEDPRYNGGENGQTSKQGENGQPSKQNEGENGEPSEQNK